jgi:hypothetical protein
MATLIVCVVLLIAAVLAGWFTLAVFVCLHIERVHRELDVRRGRPVTPDDIRREPRPTPAPPPKKYPLSSYDNPNPAPDGPPPVSRMKP